MAIKWPNSTKNKLLLGIIFFGFALRIFSIIGANYYHQNTVFYIGGDTGAWVASFDNLINKGTYTIDFNSEYGYFGRMPGYTFYIGIFYFLSGMNWALALQLVYLSQILLDTLAIYLVFQISFAIYNSNKVAIVNTLLYATYPFIIIWNPIVFSEASSVFFLILGIWFLVVYKKNTVAIAGICLSISALMRPQVICIFPLIFIILYFNYKTNIKQFLYQSILYSFSIILVYGAWPARNFFQYHKIILTQDIRGFNAWDIDINAFIEYLYSVDSNWNPTFNTIITKKNKVIFPKEAYTLKSDSVLLETTIGLCRTCGKGFSRWMVNFDSSKVIKENCNVQIATNFKKLHDSQIQNNPLNYYIILPLKNLKKALFKFSLSYPDTKIKKIASLLFVYRSILIFLGLSGILFMILNRKNAFGLIVLIFFIMVYGILCFGPTTQMRNIEMRYFLHADILLLFFSGYSICTFFEKKQSINI